jgi:hypothetical protein
VTGTSATPPPKALILAVAQKRNQEEGKEGLLGVEQASWAVPGWGCETWRKPCKS